jgi:hypothetical protein
MKPLVLLVSVLLASCAGASHWRNADVPQGQWTVDEAACQRQATREVEKEAARDQAFFGDPDLGSPNTLRARLAVYESAKHHKAIFAYCMKIRGYTKVEGAKPK